MKSSVFSFEIYRPLLLAFVFAFLATSSLHAQTWGTPIELGFLDAPKIAASGGTVQYSTSSGFTQDLAALPSTSTHLVFNQDWQVTGTANNKFTSTSLANTPQGIAMGLAVGNGNIQGSTIVTGVGFVTVTLVQFNNTGNTGSQEFPDNSTGPVAAFTAFDNSGDFIPLATTTANGASNYNGISYIPLPAGTTSGTVMLSYQASSQTITASFNGQAIGSYSIAGWNQSLPLPAGVFGTSQSLAVGAGKATVTNYTSNIGGPPAPAVALSVTSYGSVQIGQKETGTLTVTNSGTGTLSISSITYPTGFTGNFPSGNIASGASKAVIVTFAPTAATSYGGNITVNSNATSGTNTIAVSGTGVAPSGSLDVTLTPPAVVTAGATWEVDGGSPQTSGTTVPGLSVGSHTVTFNAPAGYSAPIAQTVKIVANATTKATGTYHGMATVDLTIPSPATYTGKPIIATATTTPSPLPVTITYTQNGKTASPVNVGSYLVTGTVNTSLYSGSSTGTLVISQASETVSLSGLTMPYTGKAIVPVVTTNPVAKLPVTLTYTGTSSATTPPVAVGSYGVTATISNANYSGSRSDTLNITQPVSFGSGPSTPLLSAFGAQLGFEVNPGGIATTAYFIYGTDPNNLTSSTKPQVLGTGKVAVLVNGFLGELQPNTTYYYEVMTTSPAGTFTSTEEHFTTLPGFQTTLVALTGQSAPGTAYNFATFGSSAVDAQDGAAFNANLTATGLAASDSIWANQGSNTLSLIARVGTTPSGGGAPFVTLTDPVYDDSEDVLFSGTFKSGSATETGVWYSSNGTTQLLTSTGAIAPDTNGDTFLSFSALGVTSSGGAIVAGTLTTNKLLGISAANNLGIWEGTPSSGLSLMFENGLPVTTTTTTKTIGTFKFVPAEKVVNGQTRGFSPTNGFLAVNVTYTDKATDTGIVEVTTPGSPQDVAEVGDAAPSGSGTFTAFSLPAINDSGDVAFEATLSGAAANSGAIFADNSGILELVARTGDLTFGFVSLGDPVYNANDAVAFLATFKSGGKQLSGIFCNSTGVLQVVAQTGGTAPGCPSGTTFSAFTELALDDIGGTTQQGGVRFLATLTGGGLPANTMGIFAVDTTGTLQLIARTGDTLNVSLTATPDFETISTLSFLPAEAAGNAIVGGQGRSFSPGTGDLIYNATFTGNKQGIFNVVFP